MRGLVSDLCTDDVSAWGDTEKNGQDKLCNKTCFGIVWAKKVYITPDMVEQNLAFNKTSSGSVDMLKPVIKKKRTACDNGYFEQWFEDVPDVNKQSKMELVLNQDSEGQLVYVADWNGKGFFPLDSIDDNYFL